MNRLIQSAIEEMTRSGYQRQAERAYERWQQGERFELDSHCVNEDRLVQSRIKAANIVAKRGES